VASSLGLKNRSECRRMPRPLMSEPKPNNQSAGESDVEKATAPNDVETPEQLSKEEQWALFEKELKESDWGHQPC